MAAPRLSNALRQALRPRKRSGFAATRLGGAGRQERRTVGGGSLASRAVWLGALVGALLALVLFAPARWLAEGLASASGERLLLADANGSLWQGSAVLVLTGGPGTREARTLPGRLGWTLAPRLGASGLAFELSLSHACCLNGQPRLRLLPGLGRVRAEVVQQGDWLGSWPAALLTGLGTPWNTLDPGGDLRVQTRGLAFSWVAGRFALEGQADLDWQGMSSRLSTLPRLGSYRLRISAEAAQAGTARVELLTTEGPLQLSGSGSWGATGLRLRGEARAEADDEAALSNLLNIIGRRDGARSTITIG
ncbi:MAG: hypothetical protein RL722_694 [Pseudomonadota bacterium]|jgi:general secretion pathway protein N